MVCKRECEDFPSLDAAEAALKARGFQFRCLDHGQHGQIVSRHYLLPERQDDGYFQRADVFVPYGMQIGRVSFWPAVA